MQLMLDEMYDGNPKIELNYEVIELSFLFGMIDAFSCYGIDIHY
jgi:hypothetical protein